MTRVFNVPVCICLYVRVHVRVFRHGNTLYQQIFPAQIPSRSDTNKDDDKVKKMKSRSGKPTTSSSSLSRRDAGLTLPSSYSFDYLYPPATQTQTVYQETVKVGIFLSERALKTLLL